MRDYLAGFVFGATLTAGIVFGSMASTADTTQGNFTPNVKIDSSRVEVIQQCGDPYRGIPASDRIEEDDPRWDCHTHGNGNCGE